MNADDPTLSPYALPATPPPYRALRRTAALGALAIVVAFGAYGVAAAASGPAAVPAAVAAASTATGDAPSPQVLTGPGGATVIAGPGDFGAGAMGPGAMAIGIGGGGGTVSAIGASSITVTVPGGSTRTFTTDSSTTYSKDGKSASRSDLAVGQHVGIRPTEASEPAPGTGSSPATAPASTPVAAAVNIESPRVVGMVVSVDNGTITVEDGQGFWHTVHTTGSTTYRRGGQSASASDVKKTAEVVALGSIASNHTDLDASSVAIVLPQVGGDVTGVSGGTITLDTRGGTVTVHTTSSTVYRTASGTGSASAVVAGGHVMVEGDKAPDGSYTATTVTVLPTGPGRHGGMGHWVPGPMGAGGGTGGAPGGPSA
jgi:hypothetical protein